MLENSTVKHLFLIDTDYSGLIKEKLNEDNCMLITCYSHCRVKREKKNDE